MLEAIRIRKAGYAIRIHFDQFLRRYRPILKGEAIKLRDSNPRDACHGILKLLNKETKNQYKDKWQIGFTKVFLKEETRTGLE